VCCRRVNPFGQPKESSASDGAAAPAAADDLMFPVRFLGSQQVLTDRGTLCHSYHCTHVDCTGWLIKKRPQLCSDVLLLTNRIQTKEITFLKSNYN